MTISTKNERVIAAILDYIFLTLFQAIPLIFLISNLEIQEIVDWFFDPTTTTPTQAIISLTIWSSTASLIIGFLLYVVVPTFHHGQTLGKKIMKIKVVDESGNNPSIVKHFIRSIMMWSNYVTFPTIFLISSNYFLVSSINTLVGLVAFVLIVISLIMIVSKPEEQGIHDKLVNTHVIFKDAKFNDDDPQVRPSKEEVDWLDDFDDDNLWNK